VVGRVSERVAWHYVYGMNETVKQTDLVVHSLKCGGRTHLFVYKAEQWQSQK
jgi:hypothetical protein